MLKNGQKGRLDVDSICDNNSINVIMGSVIRISLISSTHNACGPLERSVLL